MAIIPWSVKRLPVAFSITMTHGTSLAETSLALSIFLEKDVHTSTKEVAHPIPFLPYHSGTILVSPG